MIERRRGRTPTRYVVQRPQPRVGPRLPTTTPPTAAHTQEVGPLAAAEDDPGVVHGQRPGRGTWPHEDRGSASHSAGVTARRRGQRARDRGPAPCRGRGRSSGQHLRRAAGPGSMVYDLSSYSARAWRRARARLAAGLEGRGVDRRLTPAAAARVARAKAGTRGVDADDDAAHAARAQRGQRADPGRIHRGGDDDGGHAPAQAPDRGRRASPRAASPSRHRRPPGAA